MTPINWPALVRDLEATPMTARRIGTLIGASHSAVLGWKNLGKEPHHYLGECLIRLWCETTGKPREAACLESPVSSDSATFQAHMPSPTSTDCASSRSSDESERTHA